MSKNGVRFKPRPAHKKCQKNSTNKFDQDIFIVSAERLQVRPEKVNHFQCATWDANLYRSTKYW